MQNNQNIVVVDPDPDIRMTLEYTLGKAGFHVSAVKNADEGLHRCLSERPSAVLTEIPIPGMNGYELCEKIKGEPVTRQVTRVILMTGTSENEVFTKGPEVCADFYVAKPFNPTSLIADLRLMGNSEFKLPPDKEAMLCLARRIPTHREAITPGYSSGGKKVVHLNPPSVKFGKSGEQASQGHPSGTHQATPLRERDPRQAQVDELLKSLVGSFRDTQQKLNSVVMFLEKKRGQTQARN